MITLKERQFQVREATIIEAMHHLLLKKGYAATSMDDVAAEVGISKATLYLHFKSKKELVLKVIVQNLEEATAGIRMVDPSLPAAERFRRALENGIRHRASMGSTQIDEVPHEIHGDPAFQKAERRAADSVNALVREAQQEGGIRTDLAPGLIQEFIHNIFDMNFERLIKNGASEDELVAQLTDMIMRALRL
jgi:AcrR family transcriptional regulator